MQDIDILVHVSLLLSAFPAAGTLFICWYNASHWGYNTRKKRLMFAIGVKAFQQIINYANDY